MKCLKCSRKAEIRGLCKSDYVSVKRSIKNGDMTEAAAIEGKHILRRFSVMKPGITIDFAKMPEPEGFVPLDTTTLLDHLRWHLNRCKDVEKELNELRSKLSALV